MAVAETERRAEDRPLEWLEREICALAGQIAAGMAQWLVWLGEYDRRKGWQKWEMKSCAHWLSCRCGDDLHTARENVRVARALQQLPAITAAFAGGELSYSKVRALTRVAAPGTEADLLAIARNTTGSELSRLLGGIDSPDDGARTLHERRSVTTARGSSGLRVTTVELPDEMSSILSAAIEARASQMIEEIVAGTGRRRGEVIRERGGMAAVRADALIELAESWIAASPLAAERGDVGRLSMVVDPEVLVDTSVPAADGTVGDDVGGGECTLEEGGIDPDVARRWACDVRIDVLVESARGRPLHRHGRDVGRSTRVVNRRLRRALLRRDHAMCRFPGCGQTSWLHAHHVVAWYDGGDTILANLISVCGFHHRSIHEGGYQVRLDGTEVVWLDPHGRTLRFEPLRGSIDGLRTGVAHHHIGPDRCQPRWHNDRIDWPFAKSVVADAFRRARRHDRLATTPPPRRRPRGDAPPDSRSTPG